MTPSIWVTLLVGCVPALAALVGTIVMNRRNLAESRPKTQAEALDMGIDTQNQIMAGLREEVRRSRERATLAEQEAERLESRIDELEEGLAQVRQQWMESRRRERKLAQHNKVLADWCERWYQAGHPTGMTPPPKWEDFDARAIDWLSTTKRRITVDDGEEGP